MPEILAGNACLKCHHWRIQCALFTFDATQSNGQETVGQHVILEQQWCAMFTKRPQAVVPLVALRLPCVFYIFPLNRPAASKICASSAIILVCVSIFKLCKLVFLYLLGRLMMRVVVHLYAVWWCSLLRGGRPPPAAHSAQPRPLFQLLPAASCNKHWYDALPCVRLCCSLLPIHQPFFTSLLTSHSS